MKPYDKSNSFMRRVTKRVSELIPGTTWMNMLLGESQSGDDTTLSNESDDQPPVKKLCTSNNTFISLNNRTCVDTNSIENHRNTHILLPEILAVSCIPGTSRQNPKFINQSNSLPSHDTSIKSSPKRKTDVVDISSVNQPNPKTLAFASSTPTLNISNKQSVSTSSLKRPLNSDKLSTSNEFLIPTPSKLMKSRENESQSVLKFCETTSKNISSPSFRWDTFVNYGELSERQKLFAQKSPLNCSQVMYGGSSARSNLSKILGNTPPIHKKTIIPISPTNNSEIRTTSSILLQHISTKDKEIEENKFIIPPRISLRHKADQKPVSLKVETTAKIVDTTENLNYVLSNNSDREDTSRKLKSNISKKARGLPSKEYEMPTKVNLPKISLPVSVLPNIKLSNNIDSEDNEFSFNQPLTIEQFSSQIVEKTCRKKQKMNLKRIQNTSSSSKEYKNSTVLSSCNFSIQESTKKNENDNVVSTNKNDKLLTKLCNFNDNINHTPITSVKNTLSNSELTKPESKMLSILPQSSESNQIQQTSEKLSIQLKKWTCDTCWVSNDNDKINCIACQAPKSNNSHRPLNTITTTTKASSTWTCESCWVPNKNEIDTCVACQTQKPGTIKKVEEKNIAWTCDACWVKNKSDCTSCISCGTPKPGLTSENKLEPKTQFKFGLNNNTSETSENKQFKFGFDNTYTDQSSSFKFGSPTIFNTSDTTKSDKTTEFKFGFVNNKSDQSLSTFKLGNDKTNNQPIMKSNDVLNSKSVDRPSSQFKFGIEKKLDQPSSQIKFGIEEKLDQPSSQIKFGIEKKLDQPSSQFKFGIEKKFDQPENQFKFGQDNTNSKPVIQFKFGSGTIETHKSDQQNLATSSNKVTQPKNELKSIVINKNEVSEKSVDTQSKKSPFKFGDSKQTEKSVSQVSFGSVENNFCISNSSINTEYKNNDLSKGKFSWDKKDKTEIKPMNSGVSQTIQSPVGSSITTQLVNGHSYSNEDQKPSLIKTSQLFSFGSLAKQDHNLPDDQKKHKTFSFGSTINDNKSFVTPTLTTSSFPVTGPIFGVTNSVFGSGPITTSSTTVSSSLPITQFSFGSNNPTISNSFFSKTIKEVDKKPISQTPNSFASTTNVSFSFGAQSPAVFSVANTGGFIKPIQFDAQTKSTSNSAINQSNAKQSVKLDPNAPISINFTGGATTQFTAKPETTEPPTKRKILKPVRRIR